MSIRPKPQVSATSPWNKDQFKRAIAEGDVENVIMHLKNPSCGLKKLKSEEMFTLMRDAAGSLSPHAADIMSLLLQHDPSAASVSDKNGFTVLMYAARSDSPYALEIVRLLLQHDPSAASVSDKNGFTVLMHAARSDSPYALEIVRLLLQHDPGAANVRSLVDETVLMYAVKSRSIHALKIVKLLLEHNPNAWSGSDEPRDTVLMHAVKSLSPHAPDIFSFLLQYDPSAVSVSDVNGCTLSWHAAESQSPHITEIISRWLQHDPNAARMKDDYGLTLFMHAASSMSPHACEIIRMLLHYDPSAANVTNEMGMTVLMIAVRSNNRHPGVVHRIVNMLLHHGAIDTMVVDKNGKSGFIHAVEYAFKRVEVDRLIELFLKKCDYTKMLSSAGFSGLDHMLISSVLHQKNFKTCNRGRDLFKILSQCYTPNTRPLAITYCSLEICKTLLHMYKDRVANASLPDGETVLHSAIGTNSVPKCRLVMQYGPETKSLWKRVTPLELAILNRCKPQIIELVSEKLTMSEIEVSIKKCLRNGETVLGLVHSLSIQRWVNHFEINNCNSEAANPRSVHAPSRAVNDIHTVSWLDIKNYCSFKVSNIKDSTATSGNSKKRATVSKHCRTIIDQNEDEVKRIQNSVTKLIEKVARVLTEQESFMAFKCMLSGSMKENTKAYAPDELDFVCLFMDTLGLEFENRNIRCKESSLWWKLTSKDGYLDTRMVAQTFYDLVMDTILFKFDELEADLDQLHLSKYPLQRMDKISQLKLVWNGDAFPGLVINVDLVPAFEHPSYNRKVPLVGRVEKFYLLAKTSRNVYTLAIDFHLSYCHAEHAIMAALPDYIRNGYIYAKAIRIADIAGKGINLEQLDVEEDIRTDDFITSYYLKNSLFTILQKAEVKETIDQCRYAWAEAIYAELEQAVTDRRIDKWCDNVFFLLGCFGCCTVKSCCQKFALMRSLIQQIRRWLTENMELLKA